MSRFDQAPQAVVAECMAMVALAETAFTSRWRMSTLERIDKDLHDRLDEQISLYCSALISASTDELREQAGAMVRGWRAACSAVENEKHDAYLVGLDWETKTRVVVSDHKQSIQHLPPQGGVRTLAVSPAEVAKLFGKLGVVSLTKEHFPDAEVIGLHAA